MGEGRSGSLPLERMLVQSTLFIAPLVGGQTPFYSRVSSSKLKAGKQKPISGAVIQGRGEGYEDGGAKERLKGAKGRQARAGLLPQPPTTQPSPFPSREEETDFTCLLSCSSSLSFQPPPHSPTSPLKKHPRQGRTPCS